VHPLSLARGICVFLKFIRGIPISLDESAKMDGALLHRHGSTSRPGICHRRIRDQVIVRVALHDGWTVRAVGGDIPDGMVGAAIPATVPGCVHLDLMANGLIPDPYVGENERLVSWIGRTDWRYETTFFWDDPGADAEVDLVALGLDTVATIEVNGTELARTENMHRSYRFAVRDLLRVGENTLAITFAAALTAAERASEALGPRPHVNAHPFNAIRKMACNFGWNWGPELVTAGIWRPLHLETWREARIAAVRPLVEVDGTTGLLRAHVDVQRGADRPVTVEVEIAGLRASATLAPGESSALVEISAPDVNVWWPHGYGDQPLYPLTVRVADDLWAGRVGFRNVVLDTAADEHGTRFALQVNGIPVFARGVNWIPDDCFPARIDRARYAERLTQARDANVNLVRIWGGGSYESDDFYDVCDELGILVWQDFLFACAAYAEEEPLRGQVVVEAREAVTRLSPHPSLALWNGCNENVWGHEDWGWQESLQGRTWGLGYYTDVLPSIVAELDPTRPYSPASPYSFAAGRHPNDQAHGTMHVWDVWNERDYTAYRRYVPRFVAEFGFQAPPTWATLTRVIDESSRTPDSPAMLAHQKAEDGAAKLARALHGHLPQPRSFDDWHWATSLNQARAVAYGVEHFRSWSPVCMGAVLWQLNDTWPVTSWAVVDGDGRCKPVWYALRRSFADRLLTLQPRDGDLALVAVNDSAEPWRDDVTVSRRAVDGTVLATAMARVDVAPRATAVLSVPSHVTLTGDPRREVLVADAGSLRAWWHYAEDVDAALPDPDLDVTVEQVADGYRLAVTAGALVRDLAVLADRLAGDAVVDNMLVTLLPGESATFTIRTAATLTKEQLTDPLVLRSANQLTS
jgi:beta-mannosidase